MSLRARRTLLVASLAAWGCSSGSAPYIQSSTGSDESTGSDTSGSEAQSASGASGSLANGGSGASAGGAASGLTSASGSAGAGITSPGTSSGASDASGASGAAGSGGADGGAESDGPPTWANLYANDFGPGNPNGCGTMTGSCHQSGSDLGGNRGHFVCGTTSASCYQGMRNASPSLLPNGPVSDAKTTRLWQILYTGGAAAGDSSNNMPLTGYFDSGQLAVIGAWLQAGAPDK
jgi:hypothetical protein